MSLGRILERDLSHFAHRHTRKAALYEPVHSNLYSIIVKEGAGIAESV
jgi:hypothetical protein